MGAAPPKRALRFLVGAGPKPHCWSPRLAVCGSTAALCGQQWELSWRVRDGSPWLGKPREGLQHLGAAASALSACLFKINNLYKYNFSLATLFSASSTRRAANRLICKEHLFSEA